MKRLILFTLLFVLVVTLSLVAHIPASFVVSKLPQVKGLELEGLSGTIWNGSAQTVSWKRTSMGQVSWDFQPEKILQGKAEFAVRFGRGSDLKLTGTGVVGAGLSGLYAERVLASAPAETVIQYLPMALPVDVQGSLELTLSEYLYAEPWCKEAEGALVWNGSKLDSPLGSLELGAVFTDFRCQDSKLVMAGEHDAPQVSGAFDAELSPNNRYRLSAWFKPGAELPEGMKSQLKWLGNPESDGRYPFELSGKL